MVLYREIPRTSAFAWSPGSDLPIIATGTKAGVVDTEFSNESVLELWDLNLDPTTGKSEPEVVASVQVEERFHDLDWISYDNSRGLIAGALQSGVIKVWDAEKLLSGSADACVYSSPAQDNAMKRVQFSPLMKNMLASTDVAGRLHITDLSAGTTTTPFTMSASGSIDALDWNKKNASILAIGDSLGTITIFKTESGNPILSIKKPGGSMNSSIGSIAWDPERATRFAAGVIVDNQYKIFVWDVRNTTAPVAELLGHTSPVTSLSWCRQDSNLLLASSQDHQTCWNPHTNTRLVEFSNEASIRGVFETRFHPHHPSIFASASFEKTVSVLSIQSSNAGNTTTNMPVNNTTDDDFFETFSPVPKSNTFSIPQAPKWLQRPVGAKFGFGGKLVTFSAASRDPPRSNLQILDYHVDSPLKESSQQFEDMLKEGNLDSVLSDRIESAESEEDKADWTVIQALVSGDVRQKIPEYLGFPPSQVPSATDTTTSAPVGKLPSVNDEDDAAFFDNFTSLKVSEPASQKPSATASSFHIYSKSDSASDKEISKALISGSFDDALKLCQESDRWTDAFMIAICGGDKFVQKVKEAYFDQHPPTASYMRLASSIAEKNLTDIVENADLGDWKDIMVTLCTFASKDDFPGLAEKLGDRLQRSSSSDLAFRKNATFCYLVGSKLEKAVTNWIQELKEREDLDAKSNETDDLFSIHAKFLQKFIEKVTIFRKATGFSETDANAPSGWKLSALYSKYLEYANVVASVGKLDIAEKYLDLLPTKFSDVETARQRVKPRAAPTRSAASARSAAPAAPVHQYTAAQQSAHAPVHSTHAPSNTAPAYAPRHPIGHQPGGSVSSRYGPGPTAPEPTIPPPPPRGSTPSTTYKPTANWNDLPDSFLQAPKRPASSTSHAKVNHPRSTPTPPPPKAGSIPPPPKGGAMLPGQSIPRPPSAGSQLYSPAGGSLGRSASPYQPQQPPVPGPPKGSYAHRPPPGQTAPTSRYAPAASAQSPHPPPIGQSSPSVGPPPVKPAMAPPPNPYAALANQPAGGAPRNPYAAMNSSRPAGPSAATPPPPPPPKGLPRGPPKGPLSTPPPPRVSSTQSPDHYPGSQSRPVSNPTSSVSNEATQVYESIKSMWASVAHKYADKTTESRTLQIALDNLGAAIRQGTISLQTQVLLAKVGEALPDYKAAKDNCRESMSAVPQQEKIFVATVGKVLVAMASASQQ